MNRLRIQRIFSLGIKVKEGLVDLALKQKKWLDACIIFAPKYFESCLSLKDIQTELKDAERLDFDLGEIPKMWDSLRREAKPIFEK